MESKAVIARFAIQHFIALANFFQIYHDKTVPTQRDIAQRTGLTQATVSMALRNHPSVNGATKELVRKIAAEIGYRPNPFVASLMAHIRTGRHLQDRGCLAVIVNARSLEEWTEMETYRFQYEGMRQRAAAFGYYTEPFYLHDGVAHAQIDRILHSRGITGVILAAPQPAINPILLQWDRYCCATIGYTYAGPHIHRTCSHHLYNIGLAYQKLHESGYRRIGLFLPPEAMQNPTYGWYLGYLHRQAKVPPQHRVPLFIDKHDGRSPGKLLRWYKKYSPDAVLCLIGVQKPWFEKLGLQPPQDFGFACLNRPESSTYSGIAENHRLIGGAAVDLVVDQIHANDRGLPAYPKDVLIEGTWYDGETLRAAPLGNR